MPPSRNQTPSHISHKPPYTKDRDRDKDKAAGMKDPSRQSSAGNTVATGTGPPADSNSASDKKSIAIRDTGMVDHDDAKMEKRRRKKAKREREGQMDVTMAINVKSDDGPIKEEKVVKARPLAPSNVTQNHNDNQVAPKHPSSDPKQSNATTTPLINKNDAKANKLELKVEKQKMRLKEAEARAAADAERARKDTERIKELEESVKALNDTLEAKDQAAQGIQGVVDEHLKQHVEDRDQVKETLTEAVSCPICSDTLRDPHILSCGHVACRDCLKLYFSQRNAYLHEVHGDITEDRDMSYRSKICHNCRSTVLRRPTRMFNVYSFLEPLGLISPITAPIPAAAPTPSQEPVDPWANRFPPDRQTYKLHDEEDDTYRCPCCLHELEDNSCSHCDAEFSGGDDDDSVYEIGELDSEHEGVVNTITGDLRRRGARVNIAHVQDVLGTSEDDGPARGARRRAAGRNNGYVEEEDQDMVDSGSESDSGSSEFIRRRPDHEILNDSDDQSNQFSSGTGESDTEGLDRPRAGDRDFRASPIATGRRRRIERNYMIDSEADDDMDEDEDEDDIIGIYGGEGEGTEYDSEEDDGSVPRIMYTRPRRRVPVDYTHNQDEEEEESTYESSFIDDDVELDEEEEETGSNDTENENDADQMIQLHDSRAGSFSPIVEEREEDGAGQVPNIQDIRRRRLQALISGRSARVNAGRIPAPSYAFDDSE